MKVISTHESKATAQAEARKKNKRARTNRYTVRKSKYIKGNWNVVQVKKATIFGF